MVEIGEVLGAVRIERGEQAAAAGAREKASVVEGSQAAQAEGGGPEAAAADRHADADFVMVAARPWCGAAAGSRPGAAPAATEAPGSGQADDQE